MRQAAGGCRKFIAVTTPGQTGKVPQLLRRVVSAGLPDREAAWSRGRQATRVRAQGLSGRGRTWESENSWMPPPDLTEK